jgi:hypothetical protein
MNARQRQYAELGIAGVRELKAPSETNREIFRAVMLDKLTCREAAEKFEICHQRVSQIVQQMKEWITFTGGFEENSDWRERLCVTEYVHRERLDELFGRCLRGYEKSCEDLLTTKTVQVGDKPPQVTKTNREQPRRPGWYDLAFKVEKARMAFAYQSGALSPPKVDVTGAARDSGATGFASAEGAEEGDFLASSANDYFHETLQLHPQEEVLVEPAVEVQRPLKRPVGTPVEVTSFFPPISTGWASGTRELSINDYFHGTLPLNPEEEVLVQPPAEVQPPLKRPVGSSIEEASSAPSFRTGWVSGNRALSANDYFHGTLPLHPEDEVLVQAAVELQPPLKRPDGTFVEEKTSTPSFSTGWASGTQQDEETAAFPAAVATLTPMT